MANVVVSAGTCSVTISSSLSVSNGEVNTIGTLGVGTSLVGVPSKSGQQLNIKGLLDSPTIVWSIVGNDAQAAFAGGVIPPSAHASTHEDGGADELDLTGMSGLLATAQTPAAHASSHAGGGGDPITDLGGVTFGAAIDWATATVVDGTVDGNLLLTQQAGTNFGLLQFGGTTSSHPALSRIASDTIGVRLADNSAYARIIASEYLGGAVTAGGSSFISWSTRTTMRSAVDGRLQFLNSTSSGFDKLILGPENASYILLKPVSGRLQVRLANDSTWGGLDVGNIVANASVDVPAGQAYRSTNRFRIDSNADGNIRLRDWAGTSFGLLQFGGNSASYPALKRVGTELYCRLADDSAYCDLRAANFVSAGILQAGAGSDIEWAGRSAMTSPADGTIVLSNAAKTDFTALIFGDDTASFPGLFRSGIELEVKTGDGLSFTDIEALDFNLSGGGSLASHASRHSDGGADEITVEDLATAGGAGTVPTSDGAGGLTMVLPGAVDQSLVFYVGKHGSDSNNGKSPEEAFLTFGKAFTEATALTPSTTNRITVRCHDAGFYDETLNVPAYVSVEAPDAIIRRTSGAAATAINVNNDSVVRVGRIDQQGSGQYAIIRGTAAGTSYVHVDSIQLASGSNGIRNSATASDAVLLIEAGSLLVFGGSGIVCTTASHIHLDIEDIYLDGNNSIAINCVAAGGSIVARIAHILERGALTGTEAIRCSNGKIEAVVSTISTDIAWNVTGSGELNMFVGEATGTRTETGTVNVTEAGQFPTHATEHDAGGTDVITGLGPVTFSGAIDWTAGSQLSGLVDGYFLMQNQAGTGFTGLRLGGTSSSFPMLKVSANDIDLKSADDSSYTDFRCNNVTAFGNLIAGSDVRAGPASNDRIYWLSSTTMTAPSDGNLLLQNASLNAFNMLQFGGTTSAFPALKRSTVELYCRKADDSGYADFRCNNLLTAGTVQAGASSRIEWSGRSRMTSPVDGNILLQDNAATTFNLLQFGGTTAAFPALKRSGDDIQVRLANDAAFSDIVASNFVSGSTSLLSHGSRHENGGADEISVAGLSGLLADAQNPVSHSSTHENGGADEISVAGLSGALADPQTPTAHASSHGDGGTDEIDAGDLGSGVAGSGSVLTADGAGGVSWSAVAGGTQVKVTASDTTAGYLDDKLLAGAGLTRTILNPAGDEDYRMDVVAHADGSIVVSADNIQVGVLASDAQHGTRGGGTQHALAIASGAAGFLTGADKQTIDDLATTYAPLNHAARHDASGGDTITDLGAVTFSGIIDWTSATKLDGLTDGDLQILNQAGTGVVGIHLGPKTASFPFLKRNGADIDFRNGADTDYVDANVASLIATQLIELGAAFALRWTGRSRIQTPVNGNFLLTNAGETDFGVLQFGGTTSAYPALKRVSNYLQVRRANDGAFTTIEALDFDLSVGGSLATHASRHANGGGDPVDHDTLTNYVANEHLDWTSDQGITNIDPNNLPSIVETGLSTVLSWGAIADTEVLRRSGTSIVGQATSATPGASTIPISDGTGVLSDGWISSSSVTQHEGDIDHDALLNFAANEHIDWTADQGATNIDANNIPSIVETGLSTVLSWAAIADTQVLYRTGTSIAGRAASATPAASTIVISNGTGVIADGYISSSSVTQHEGDIDHDALLNFVANEHLDWTADQGATNIDPGNIPSITETGGPTDLTWGSIADGYVVRRSGTSLVGIQATATPTANAIPIADGTGSLDNWVTHTDTDAIHDNVAGEIAAVAEKTVIDKDDWVLIEDSEATNAKKAVQVENLMVLPHGGLYAEEQTTAIVCVTQGTFYLYNQFEANMPSKRTTPDHTQDRVTVTEDGNYLVVVSGQIDGELNSDYDWRIFVNAVATNYSMDCLFDQDPKALSINGIVTLVANDYVDLRVACVNAANQDAFGYNVQLSLMRLG